MNYDDVVIDYVEKGRSLRINFKVNVCRSFCGRRRSFSPTKFEKVKDSCQLYIENGVFRLKLEYTNALCLIRLLSCR